MAKLYELTDDYISLYARLDDCTCENEAQEILGEIIPGTDVVQMEGVQFR